jgi:TetR/AcrR family transcriptional regulator
MSRTPRDKPRKAAPANGSPVRGSQIAERNVAKILVAAEAVFADAGFHGATVDAIAERARISKSNLHYYFRTKTDLYLAVLQNTLAIWTASLARLDPEGDPRAELSAYIGEKLEMSMRHPTASRVFANEILRGAPLIEDYLKTELRALVREKARVLQRWIDEGRLRPIDPVHLIFLIWAATQHYADFLPQVRAILGVKEIRPALFKKIAASLGDIILNGVLDRGE